MARARSADQCKVRIAVDCVMSMFHLCLCVCACVSVCVIFSVYFGVAVENQRCLLCKDIRSNQGLSMNDVTHFMGKGGSDKWLHYSIVHKPI